MSGSILYAQMITDLQSWLVTKVPSWEPQLVRFYCTVAAISIQARCHLPQIYIDHSGIKPEIPSISLCAFLTSLDDDEKTPLMYDSFMNHVLVDRLRLGLLYARASDRQHFIIQGAKKVRETGAEHVVTSQRISGIAGYLHRSWRLHIHIRYSTVATRPPSLGRRS